MQTILVTGANTGIGLALCKQLCKDHGAKVFLGSRSADKGATAVQQVKEYAGGDSKGQVELLQIDVGSDDSVTKAAASLKEKGVKLTAIVNNAGTGLGHGVTNETVLNVNLMGVKRVVDAFTELLDPQASRIVNVGSGSGPLYVRSQPIERQKKLCNPDITWEEIKEEYDRGVPKDDPAHGQVGTDHYGLSKALLTCYTMMLAKTLAPKNISVYCLTPGYIDTAITAGWPGGKPPEEGTVAIRHCLFETTKEESGQFFGSDAKRSPLHFLRNPGEPVSDGTIDWEAVEKDLAK
ncbi:Carbonyl reductase [NADPH] 1 [Seminavis robusta]|uniref:Carbonyl reductase [NADPH] 1 n=1 Tax=Seminavis robusta TaxID=568900 RepID=A0A9N8H3V1_9STRA|nr:Carbonyl reductase [NADPH] 1 [Seminavis robusta]|eukprot:Sro97_g050020.1 Carbonyl reductase [NADPH] 1 (293) ;mRNA; r:67944-68921